MAGMVTIYKKPADVEALEKHYFETYNAGVADGAYRSLLKTSFYADVAEADFAQAAA